MNVSVVVATYNRGPLLRRLIDDLERQSLPSERFDVTVVDDGSREPASGILEGMTPRFKLKVERQDNAGPGAARDRGVRVSKNPLVVFVDDDMELPDDFLEAHLAAIDGGLTVVQGLIAPDPSLATMPIFERFHADQLERFIAAVESGTATVRGVDLCTGNLGMLRRAYEGVGGFDKTLGRSEDRELGVRLESAGEKLGFSARAKTLHRSDHASLEVWRKRAYNYGIYDHRISEKHEQVETADPWRFWFMVNPVSRPLLMAAAAVPFAGKKLADVSIHAAMALDRAGVTRLAIAGTTLCYGLEYFRGVREDCGSLGECARDFVRYLGKRKKA
jgi:GT2 family glycosyltransferase